jgi:predicted Zn-dependent peptidase
MAKRMKLSPTSTELTLRQQQTTSPNVTTTNNQLNATSGLGSNNNSNNSSQEQLQQQSTINQQPRKCQTQINEINAWNVEQVCDFVQSIDICMEYVNVSTFDIIY